MVDLTGTISSGLHKRDPMVFAHVVLSRCNILGQSVSQDNIFYACIKTYCSHSNNTKIISIIVCEPIGTKIKYKWENLDYWNVIYELAVIVCSTI